MKKKEKTQKTRNIKFKARVWQVKTFVDGGINITLSLSEKEIEHVSDLLKYKERGAIFDVVAVPVFVIPQEEENAKKGKDSKNRISRRRKRYPYR